MSQIPLVVGLAASTATISGPYLSTPSRYFIYDAATVNGVAMANAKTRVAEAYTATCVTCTKVTDLGFSYNALGQASDVYESTPHSGVYYHLSSAYFPNGAVNTIGGLPGLPTITYNVDGEGRISTISAASGQNPVSSTSYNPASLPMAVTFGSLDGDAFTYDLSTDRMTQYKFTVNGQSLTGALTWNAIGTLKTLGITDPFFASDTQTCNYAHDDLSRVASVNCGAAWSQTFSYGADGSVLAETIPAGWNVGYVHLDGAPMAEYENGTTYFIHRDHLGSTRLMTQMNGTVYDSLDFMPFGEQSSGDTGTSHKFEGKERDAETSNDDFGARYYSSGMARWLTPDWSAREEAVPYATLANPQTLNLYSFVANNPLAAPDLDGHFQSMPGYEGYSPSCGFIGPGCQGTESTTANDQTNNNNSQSSPDPAEQQSTVTVEYVKGQDGNPAGHAAISVDGKQAVGFEQKKDSATAAVEDKTNPGAVKAVDPNREVKDKAVLQVSPGQAAKIQAFLNNAKQNTPNYNLYHSNCAQFCESALRAGGVKNVPNDVTPRGLVHDLNGSPGIIGYIRMMPIPPFY